MADNGILILYNKVDIFIDKKIREGILSIKVNLKKLDVIIVIY